MNTGGLALFFWFLLYLLFTSYSPVAVEYEICSRITSAPEPVVYPCFFFFFFLFGFLLFLLFASNSRQAMEI